MRVFIVVNDRLALNALLRGLQIDVNHSVRGWRRGERGNLEGIERLARVAIRDLREMRQSVFVGANLYMAQTALRVVDSTLQQLQDVMFGERAQLEDLRARN